MNDTPLKDRWYVDVRGNVSIMATEEIIERLYSGELKVVYRISRNKQDWQAICNEPSFEKMLQEEMKALSAETFEETPIVQKADLEEGPNDELGFDVNTVKGQISDQLVQAKKMQEVGLALSNVRRVLADIAANKKIVHDGTNQSLEVDVLHIEDRDVFMKNPVDKIETQKKVKKAFRILVAAGITLIIFVQGVSMVVDYLFESENKRNAIKTKLQEKQKRTNRYQGAVANFNGISSAPKNQVPGAPTPTEEHDSFKAQFNTAVDFMQRGDFASAEPVLLDTFKFPNHDRAALVLALFETALRLDQKEMKLNPPDAKNPQERPYPRVSEVGPILDRLDSSSHILAGEITLARITKGLLLGENNHASLSHHFIEQYPAPNSKDGLEDGMNYTRLSWGNVCNWLVEAMASNRADAFLNAALASCMARGDQAVRAKPYIDYAFKKSPDDPSIEILAGHLYLVSGDVESAKKIIYKQRALVEPSMLLEKSKEYLCGKYPADENCVKRVPAAMPPPGPLPPPQNLPRRRK